MIVYATQGLVDRLMTFRDDDEWERIMLNGTIYRDDGPRRVRVSILLPDDPEPEARVVEVEVPAEEEINVG